jgi:hypothetical protein
MGDVPKYQQPPLDPVYGQLLLQSQQQAVQATQADVGAQAGRIAARFGTANYGPGGTAAPGASATPALGGGIFTSSDPGALLAWHGMQLAAGGAKLPGLGR